MTELTRVGDIDVPQDLRYERRAYRVRQVFTPVFGAVLLAGVLGLLGRGGALSDTRASADGVSVGYERFLRARTPTDLEVRITRGAGMTDVALSQSLLDGFRVEGYSVEPESTKVLPDRVVYTFDQRAPSEVTFTLEPERSGLHEGTVFGPGGASVRVRQWTWP